MINFDRYKLSKKGIDKACDFEYFLQAEVLEIGLNNDGPGTERKLAIIDKNRDLYIRTVRQVGAPKTTKLCMSAFVSCPFHLCPCHVCLYCMQLAKFIW